MKASSSISSSARLPSSDTRYHSYRKLSTLSFILFSIYFDTLVAFAPRKKTFTSHLRHIRDNNRETATNVLRLYSPSLNAIYTREFKDRCYEETLESALKKQRRGISPLE